MKLEGVVVACVVLVGCSRPQKPEKVFADMHAAACSGDATKFFTHVSEDRFRDDAVKNGWQKDIAENGGEICGWSYVAVEKSGERQRVEVRSKTGDKKFLFFERVGRDLELVAFEAIGSSTAPSATASESASAEEVAPPPSVVATVTASATSTPARIGERVAFEDSEWVVIEARSAGKTLKSNSEFMSDPKTTAGRFIQIHFRLTNKTKKEQMLLDQPKLVDARSRAFGPIEMESYYVPPKAKTIMLEVLQPDIAKEYWTVIEVPADAEGLRFEMHGFSLLGPTKSVDLGL